MRFNLALDGFVMLIGKIPRAWANVNSR